MEKDGVDRPIVIPKYNELCNDIINSNMRTARMDRDTYFKYVNECK